MKKYLVLCLVLFCSQIGLSSQAYVGPNIALTGSTTTRNADNLKHEEQYHNSVYEVENLVGYFVMERKNDQRALEYVLVKRFQTVTYYSCGQHIFDYQERFEYVRPATEEEIEKFKSTEKFLHGALIFLTIFLILLAVTVALSWRKTNLRTPFR